MSNKRIIGPRRIAHTTLAICLMTSLAGCAAFLVPETSDPRAKLYWAQALYSEQNRPLPAEHLIRQAVEIYRKNNDQLGLAETYRIYGFFFRSRAVESWAGYYEEHGFRDKSATYDTRFAMSLEYLEKARDIYATETKYDALTNIYLNIGFTYGLMKNVAAACDAFDKSLEAYRANLQRDPDANVLRPHGYHTYEAYLAAVKRQRHCKQ